MPKRKGKPKLPLPKPQSSEVSTAFAIVFTAIGRAAAGRSVFFILVVIGFGFDFHVGKHVLEYFAGVEADFQTDDAIYRMEVNPSESFEMELGIERDGLFEDDEQYYIFSRNEVQQMVDVLTQALKDGYDKE